MTPNQRETKRQLLTLLENELWQEDMDGMVFAIQQRIITYNGDTLSAQKVKGRWIAFCQDLPVLTTEVFE